MADEAQQDTAPEADEQNNTDAADQSTVDDDATAPDFEEKFRGAQKVNRDLERKLAEARKGADRVAELEAALAQAQGKEAEHAEALKERERDAAALARANDRIRRSEIRAAAKGVLADPSDALTFLDLESIEVSEDGEVDEAAIASALADLIKTKPYLAAQGERRFQGDTGGGARKDARPAQLTRADLARMSPQEINAAHREGRTADLLKP